jgi:acyl-CoA synthetase (AMP-forming)/AMP-acid ligase II/acyl carrier protein/SAM-dependent methyltransferase
MNDSGMLDESLIASARVARRFALEHCPHTAAGDCSWYHGVWQYFRALGVTKMAGGSADFLGAVLRSLAAGGGVRRIMISGAADDAMSLLALAAFRDVGKVPDLTLVDRCEAPLALARWSAERLGASVATQRSDILSFNSTAKFDLVLTNSFLGAFDPARRRQLFARWASLLRHGGKILFTNRVRHGEGHAQFGFTPDQARVFCTAVRRAAERAKQISGWTQIPWKAGTRIPNATGRILFARWTKCWTWSAPRFARIGSRPHMLPDAREGTRAGPSVAEPAGMSECWRLGQGVCHRVETPKPGTLLSFVVGARSRASPAILAPGRTTLTYESLFRQVERTGKALAATGIARRSRVAIALPNGPELAVALLGAASYATAAPLNPATEEQSCSDLLRSLRVKAVIVPDRASSPVMRAAHEQGLQIVRLGYSENDPAGTFVLLSATPRPAIPVVPVRMGDVAILLTTSGTTSSPKLVPLTHAQILARPRRVLLRSSDRCICVSPLFTATALGTSLLGALMEGASVVIPPEFRAERFVEWVNEFKPTYLTASSAVLASLLEVARQGRLPKRHSLRFLRSTSNALPAHLQQALEEVFGVPVIQAYSMTETGAISENPLPPGIRKPGSVGLPLAQVAIVSDAGSLQPGEQGEIMVRGPRVSAYEDPEANDRAFSDGWFRTGDQGYLDKDGYLFLTGRITEVINRGGVKVYPREIDEALLCYPGVLDAAAFAVPHRTLGEDVAAAVVLRERGSTTTQQLRDFALERLATYKVPSSVVFVDGLARNALGKVQRGVLAATLGPSLRAASVAPRDVTEQRIANIFAEVLRVERIAAFDNFFELGGDSLSATSAVALVNSAFGASFTVDRLFRRPTVAELAAELVAAKITESGSIPPPILPRKRTSNHDAENAGK